MFLKSWLYLAVIFVLIACLSPRTSTAQEADITGIYTCVGENAHGNQYRGTVQITKVGDTYELKWTIAGRSHIGLAIREGNILSSCWLAGGSGGIVVYRIEKGLKLVGRWSEFGTNGRVLTETLTKKQ